MSKPVAQAVTPSLAHTAIPTPAPGGSDQVCFENIGPQERRKRSRFGALALAVAIAAAAALVLSGADRWWRVGLFLPFAASAVGFLQAHEKT